MRPTAIETERARRWMGRNWRDFVDDCGAVDLTGLAEACADAIGFPEWCDDPQSPVWDWSLEQAAAVGRLPL